MIIGQKHNFSTLNLKNMINIFSFDIDKYDMDQVRNMFDKIKKVLPEDDILIAIPKNCNLYLDVPIELLYYYREMFDDIIQERQRRNMNKNDL